MEKKELAILLEILYKDAGMKSAQAALEKLEQSGKKTEESVRSLATNMNSFEGRVNALYSSLQKATPQNLRYAQTFEKIKQDLADGNITIDQARQKVGELREELGSAEQPTNNLTSAIGNLVTKAALVAIATKALKEGFEFLKESTLLAARVETLGVVTETLGAIAGNTAREIRAMEISIQKMGITVQASRQAIAQMLRAEIDLAKGTELARLAQDAAVIANENSSEAFQALTYIIGTGNTYMARRRGLLVDFVGAYDELATSLGKTTAELTQQEKVTARTNEVLKQGKTIVGTYEAAMETGGKKLLSYERYWEDLKVAIGEGFTAALADSIDALTDWTIAQTEIIRTQNLLKASLKDNIITGVEYADTWTKIRDGALEYEEVMVGLRAIMDHHKETVKLTVGSYEEYEAIYNVAAEAAKLLGIEITKLSEEEFTHLNHVRLLNLAYRDAGTGMSEFTAKSLVATIAMANAARVDEEYFLGARKVMEMNIEVGKSLEYTANNADLYAAAQQRIADSLSESWSAMTKYSDIFDAGRWEARTGVMDAFKDSIVAQLEALYTQPSGPMVSERIELLTAALRELDPKLADGMEASLLFAEYQEKLNTAYLQGKISLDEYVKGVKLLGLEFTGFGVPLDEIQKILEGFELPAKKFGKIMEGVKEDLDAGVSPAEALANALGKFNVSSEDADKAVKNLVGNLKAGQDPAEAIAEFMDDLAEKTADAAVNLEDLDPKWLEKFEPSVLEDLKGDLDTVTDKADDPILKMQDEASKIVDPVLIKLGEYAKEWTATLKINDLTGGNRGDNGGDDGGDDEPPQKWTASAMASPVYGRVPSGHENDSYRVAMRSGEDYAVWNRNQSPPNLGKTTTVTIPVQIGQISSQIDVDDLLNQIQRRIEETS